MVTILLLHFLNFKSQFLLTLRLQLASTHSCLCRSIPSEHLDTEWHQAQLKPLFNSVHSSHELAVLQAEMYVNFQILFSNIEYSKLEYSVACTTTSTPWHLKPKAYSNTNVQRIVVENINPIILKHTFLPMKLTILSLSLSICVSFYLNGNGSITCIIAMFSLCLSLSLFMLT